MKQSVLRVLSLAVAMTVAASAQTVESASPSSSWWDELLRFPLLRLFLAPQAPAPFERELTISMAPPPPPCLIEPLETISDLEAFEMESRAGAVVNIDGMQPTAAQALARFELMVTSAGGRVELTSAYRPAAYQEHLQSVWDKYMALRGNQDEACAALKEEVTNEFVQHQLLASQRPVAFSDHTRGVAFDAAVSLPSRARLKGKRVTLDRLASRVGLRRPDIRRDPVHFRYIGG